MTIKYRLFMRKIKGDCDVIAYPDVVFDAKKQKQNKHTNKQIEKDFKNTKKKIKKWRMGWIARLYPPPSLSSHTAEEAGGTPRGAGGGGCSWVG